MRCRPNAPVAGLFASSARWVKRVRKQSGLSQSKFCTKYRFTFRTYQAWEMGRTRPSDSAEQRLAKILADLQRV